MANQTTPSIDRRQTPITSSAKQPLPPATFVPFCRADPLYANAGR